MNTDTIAKKIVADHHAAPPPLAGAWDKDADLVRRIATAMEKQETDLELLLDEIVALKAKIVAEETRGDVAIGKHADLQTAIRAYAEELDTETFGAGLALPADLHTVAERLRGIVR